MAESTSIRLADGLKERVKAVAESKNRSPNWLMNEAIAQYVEREESDAEFRAEALRRVRYFRETGLHVTHEEAKDWLLRRSRGERIAPPKEHL